MEFDSIEACVSHIKKCMANSSQNMARDTQIQGRNIVKGQLKGYSARPSGYKFPYQGSTGATASSVTITNSNSNGMTVEMLDSGGWYSVITGEHF